LESVYWWYVRYPSKRKLNFFEKLENSSIKPVIKSLDPESESGSPTMPKTHLEADREAEEVQGRV